MLQKFTSEVLAEPAGKIGQLNKIKCSSSLFIQVIHYNTTDTMKRTKSMFKFWMWLANCLKGDLQPQLIGLVLLALYYIHQKSCAMTTAPETHYR